MSVARTSTTLASRGEWVATVRYRPLNGGDTQLLRRFASSETYAYSAIHEALDERLGRVQTIAPDSDASRLLIEAGSHAYDLQEALTALSSARNLDATSGRMLSIYAVVAYGRTFGSYARRDLSEFVSFSADDSAIHETAKLLRNKFAAHSENTMSVTHPLLDLVRRDGSVSVEQVLVMTTAAGIPEPFLSEFEAMVERLKLGLREAFRPMKEALTDLPQETLAALFDEPVRPRFVPTSSDDWAPGTARTEYPASHETPVHFPTAPRRST